MTACRRSSTLPAYEKYIVLFLILIAVPAFAQFPGFPTYTNTQPHDILTNNAPPNMPDLFGADVFKVARAL